MQESRDSFGKSSRSPSSAFICDNISNLNGGCERATREIMTESSAGIEIQNLPTHLTHQDLFRVFSRGLDVENEIKFILYPIPGIAGKAFVFFKHKPDIRFIEGLLVANPLWSIKFDTRMQTFNTCSAEVNSLVVASIPDIWDCIRMLQKSYGVVTDYSENSEKLVLKGSLHQLLCAQEKLDSIFEEQIAFQKLGLMHVSKSNSHRITEYDGSEDGFAQKTSVSAGLESSRVLGKNVDKEEEFHGDAQILRSEKKKRNPPSGVLTLRSDMTSSVADCDRNLILSRSLNESDHLQSYFDQKSELPRSEFKRTRGSGPQSLPCFSELNENKVFSRKPRNASEDHSEFEKTKNRPHLDSTGHRQISVDDEREDAEGEKEFSVDDIVEEPQDFKPVHGISSESPLLRDISETSAIRFASAGGRDNSRHIKSTMKAAGDAVIASRPLHKTDLYDDENHGNITSSVENKLEFNSGAVSLPPNPSVYSDDAQHHRMRADRLFGLDRESHYSPEQVIPKRDLEQGIEEKEEDSHRQDSLFLESFVVRYIIANEKDRVNTISKRCYVDIKVNNELGSDIAEVVFFGHRLCQEEDLKRALKKFTALYEETFNDIIQRDVRCDSDRSEVVAVMKHIRLLLGDRVILITDNPGVITVVGEFKEVMKALDMLNEAKSPADNRGSSRTAFGRIPGKDSVGKEVFLTELKMENSSENEADKDVKKKRSQLSLTERKHSSQSAVTSNSSVKGRTATSRTFSSVQNELNKRDYSAAVKSRQTQLDFIATPNTDYFQVTFKENFFVFNYTGDITKIRVHAIVNAANSFLKNYGGVAGAIERAGGLQFEKDCELLYLSHGPLKVSEVVHTDGCGALECAFVIHTVGPQWYSDNSEKQCAADLQATFRNVLEYADTVLQSASLAVPPVGTGVFGVPLDVCARAIFFAVTEFVENRPSDSPLNFLHIVSKDPGTTELIQAVFEGLQATEAEVRQVKPQVRHSSIDEIGLSADDDDQDEISSIKKSHLETSNEDA